MARYTERVSAKNDKGLSRLRTELPNPAAAGLDTMSALDIVRVMNAEDAKVPLAIRRVLPLIARAIDAIASAISVGGRLIYVGAGTSGRIAALDAAECSPTFSTAPGTVQFVMAGGEKALGRGLEANEDLTAVGRRDIARRKPGKRDVVVGVAASGRTPYTVAAVRYARGRGATTVAVTCNPESPLERAADIAIVAEVGPEVVAGSTRLKAGTAQKLVLNMLSTGAMARLGYVYGNLMVNVPPKNSKLAVRAATILKKAAGVDFATAARTLKSAGNSVPVALIMLKTGMTRREAQQRLRAANGNVRDAIG